MIPLHNRLKTLWRKKLPSTKPAADCGDGAEEREQTESHTLDYNRNYRLSDACRHRVRKFLLHDPAPLVPLSRHLENIERKISRSIKRACAFAAACWRSGKKVLLRVLAPLVPIYRRLKIIWRQNLRSIKRTARSAARYAEVCLSHGKKVLLRALAPLLPLCNRLQTIWRKLFPSTTRVPYSGDWLSRTAMAGAITFGVALIANASVNGNLLTVAGSTLQSGGAT